MMEREPGNIEDTVAKAEAIKNAQSFDELYDALRAYGPVSGSKEIYDPEKIIQRIEQARVVPHLLEYVTNGGELGIRKKVIELIEQEQGTKLDDQK